MDRKSNAHLPYDLPAEFYELVKKYLDEKVRIQSEEELIQLWHSALKCAISYPENREAIAEWTMSIGSYMPYITDNNLFQALHEGFGSLEVADSMHGPHKDADAEWSKQKALFDTLLSERKHTK